MTKRIVWVPTVNVFKTFLLQKNIEVDTIQDEGVRKAIDDLGAGCFALAIKINELVEAIVMHKFPKNVNMMVSRENIYGLHLRYLTREERESVSA